MLIICSLSFLLIIAVYVWHWHRAIRLAAWDHPQVFIFEWNGKRVEVAAERLTEWLALRQLANDEWPPMCDLLEARRMIHLPTTETDLRREVWSNLDRVRRAYRRGREALDGQQGEVAESSDGSSVDS